MLTRRRWITAATAQLAAASPALAGTARRSNAEPTTVVLPRHLPQQDRLVDHFIALVTLALGRSGTRYQLRQTRSDMVQSRAVLDMAGPQPSLDIFWTMTDLEREHRLLPIRVPLDRGLIGWRLCLVRESEPDRLQAVQTLDDLSRLQAGQMHDWPDTAILRANGLPVQTSPHYQGLFQMLSQGRFDYFPRALFEIDAELQTPAGQGLRIDPHLLLHYPAAMYLFVRPGRPRLAADLLRGMDALVADGSFDRLSRQHFGPLVQRHELERRRVLQLRNPLLPPQTPLARRALWWPLPGER